MQAIRNTQFFDIDIGTLWTVGGRFSRHDSMQESGNHSLKAVYALPFYIIALKFTNRVFHRKYSSN